MSQEEPRQPDAVVATLREHLAPRYQFRSRLGRGANAVVYRVTNLKLGRDEALKVLTHWADSDPDYTQRFIREAYLAAALDHPNIVKIFDIGDMSGLLWFSMQLVDGPTLAAYLRLRGPLDEQETRRIAAPILEALEHSHAQGIVHRDIKPGNIILDGDRRPHVTDFGIAKSADSMLRTQTGVILGTPAYVAPEQAQGQPLDGRADLYALGIVMYEMLTGALPFEASDSLQTVLMRITTDAPRIEHRCPDLDPALASVVMAALERDREARFPSAAAMRAALLGLAPPPRLRRDEALEAAAPPVATAAGVRAPSDHTPTTRLRKSPLGSRRALAAAGVASAAIIAGGIGIWRAERRDVDASPASPAATPVTAETLAAPTEAPAPTAAPTPASERAADSVAPQQPARGRQRVQPPAAAEPMPLRRPVVAPRIVSSAAPELAGELAAQCAGALVNVSAVVAEDGTVADARLLAAPSQPCGEVALDAVRRYRYEPARDAEGRPIKATVAIAVQFSQ